MNQIEAIKIPSLFVPEPHLVIAVDGTPLDVALDKALPGNGFAGLVSSLLGWFHNDEDGAIPWSRILPEIGCTGYAPVLICPDDLDYSCSVVVAEVVAEADIIRWDRLGLDATRRGVIGSCVRWLSELGSYRFDRSEYERSIAAFGPPDASLDGAVTPHPRPA